MRALVQRVNEAEVEVAETVVGRIGRGLLVYLGVACGDVPAGATRLAEKVAHIRLFKDEADKLNLSVQDVGGGILAVPNFSLMAETGKGRRPAFVAAAGRREAEPLYQRFCSALAEYPGAVACGVFGARMIVRSAADGPVNVIVEMPAGGAEQEVRPTSD